MKPSPLLAWVTGAGGLIGQYLVQLAPRWAPHWRVRGLTRADLDLTDFAAVERAIEADRPALVIHCAALSRSPDCESDPALAQRLNVEVTRALADFCAAAPMVFFSSDLVFDGRQGNYDEAAVPHPLSVYARTKAEAEAAVLRHPRHLVIRTSLNGGSSPTGDRGFNEQMRCAWRAGRTLRLFTDEYRSPQHAAVTAAAAWELALAGATGICHVAGTERLSRWEIGQIVAARCPELSPRLAASCIKDYEGAPRPPDTSLNCAKAQRLLSFPLPELRAWLAAHPDEPF
jgi:dTDP-4-dehydrorhamnose reductase